MRSVTLTAPGDFDEWRHAARRLLAEGAAPQDICWRGASEGEFLFGDEQEAPAQSVPLSIPRNILAMIERAICLNDPAAPARLYRIIWRAATDPVLFQRATDADIDWLYKADKAIRRDVHKMHAFVRFRKVGEEGDRELFAAWFEPAHHILRLAAPFFRRRFFGMDWMIITPTARAIWKNETLHFGPGGTKNEIPQDDAIEDQWRTYYGSIFNPARVKINAMRAEMPKKYWKNLPEAQDIAPLLAAAAQRAEHMRASAVSDPNPKAMNWRKRMDEEERRGEGDTLGDMAQRLAGCTRCPLHCGATQAVAGEGPADAAIMFVGEQPGDREDLEGRPFVGPAGQVLDTALARAAIDRRAIYLTNAVKHFKYKPQGKRRLHQTPTAGEIDMCRWWLDRERALVRPRLIVSLGASAYRAVTGRSASIASVRGKALDLGGGTRLIATIHPSYLLRLPDEDRAAAERRAFVGDLAAARDLAA